MEVIGSVLALFRRVENFAQVFTRKILYQLRNSKYDSIVGGVNVRVAEVAAGLMCHVY